MFPVSLFKIWDLGYQNLVFLPYAGPNILEIMAGGLDKQKIAVGVYERLFRAIFIMAMFLGFFIRPPPGLLPELGPLGLEVVQTPTLDFMLTDNIEACIINPRRDPAFYNLNCDIEFPLLNN